MTIKNLEATVTQQVAAKLDEQERQRQNRKILKELERTQNMLRKKFYEDVESTSEETEVEHTTFNKTKGSFEKTHSTEKNRRYKVSPETKETLRKSTDKTLQWERLSALLTKPAPDLIKKNSLI